MAKKASVQKTKSTTKNRSRSTLGRFRFSKLHIVVVGLFFALVGGFLVFRALAATTSVVYSGSITTASPTATYSLTTGAGQMSASIKARSRDMVVTIKDKTGTVISTVSDNGQRSASTTFTVTSGTYSFIVSSANPVSSRKSYTLTLSYPLLDSTSPTAIITSPLTGDMVSGIVNFSATATDDVAVTKVEFYVGSTLLATDTSSPYTTTWDTTKVANGTTSLLVKSYDATGNVGEASLSVIVSNVTPVVTTCPSGQIGTPPDCYVAPPAPLASGKQWKMLFHDEFEGSALNTSNFTTCFDWNYGACTGSFNTGKEWYNASQVTVSGGSARLVAEPMSPAMANGACYLGQCTYKAGLISTARPRADNGSNYLHPFTYGYIESRLKYPAISGMFTAFWLLPTDPTYNYQREIDIAEILGGDPQTIFMTYHYGDNRSKSNALNNGDLNNGSCPVTNYSTDWVRLGLDWEPTYIAWYINGVKCGQFDGDATTISNVPMQMILHMMVDNSWERSTGLVLANQGVSATLDVDYVRVYQQQ